MSTYVREKVLRVPVAKCLPEFLKLSDPYEELEKFLGSACQYATVGKFQIAPTETFYIDYVLEYDWDCSAGEFGKTRALHASEKAKYKSKFESVIPTINMDDVRLVEFAWYNSTDANDYYDETEDDFYNEI